MYDADKDAYDSWKLAIKCLRVKHLMETGEVKKVQASNVEYIGFPEDVLIYGIKKNGVVFYIGSTKQTIENRIRKHISDARKGSWLPIHEWMRENNYCFDVVFLERVNKKIRVVSERHWMQFFNKNLLNLTDGGPGMSGHYFAGTSHAVKIGNGLKTGAFCTCVQCGSEFWRKRREIALGNNKFCSRNCYHIWQRGKRKKGTP